MEHIAPSLEPKWLPWLPFIGSLSCYSMHTNHTKCAIAPGGAIMAATYKTKGALEGAEGAICLNSSSGSLKSSFSSVCEGLQKSMTYQIVST